MSADKIAKVTVITILQFFITISNSSLFLLCKKRLLMILYDWSPMTQVMGHESCLYLRFALTCEFFVIMF